MKKFIVYGTAVLALSSAPVYAQVGSGTSGQGGVTPVPNSTSQPPTSAGATDQSGSRPGTATPDDSTPDQPNAPTGSGARGGRDDKAEARNEQNGTAQVADQGFVLEAARGGMAEVELGHLAEQKAVNDRVKQFGQRMIADHGKANSELKAIAESKDITVPMDLGDEHKATMDRLSQLSGPAFDRAYIQEMVADHTKDVVEFKKESENGKDPAVKAFAAKTLPTIEEHMKMVQDIYKGLGSGAVGTSGAHPDGHQPAAPNPR
jgi:putative membrane protein